MVVKANDSRAVPDGRITEDAPEGHPVWRVRIHPDTSNGSWNARFPDGENGKLKKRRPELQSCCRGGSHYAGDLAAATFLRMDDEVGPITLDGKREVASLIRSRFLQRLKDVGGGSFLHGWRTHLDPDFRQRASKQDLCRAVLGLSLQGGEAAAHVLLVQFGSCEALCLVEIAPDAGVLVCRFRRFLAQFGNMRNFLEDVQEAGNNMELSFEQFVSFCRRHGFDPGGDELRDLFCLCSKGKDHLSPEDFLFLEADEGIRQQETIRQSQLKFAKEDVHHAFLAETYKADRGRPGISNRHRLAPRPWHDRAFETLPQVISRRNQSWFQEKRSKNAEARQHFLEYIRASYGSEVRAWRRALDPDATFQLTLSTFKRWFRHETNLRECIDLQTLWRSLDRDGSGRLGLEELAPQAAATLGCFRTWIRGRLGSCASAWEHEAVADAFSNLQSEGSWVSRTKLLVNAFAKAVKQIGWRPILDQGTRAALLASLDYFGCGFLSRSDLEWLDAWDPPEWLYSEPDAEAWVHLRRLIMGRGVLGRSCCSYARHLRPRFGDCGLRTCPKDNVFFYDFLLENRLWTYVHHEHHAPERSHDSSKAAASFLPVLLWPLAVNSFGSWRLGGHRCTSSTARVRSRPSR
eukprot:s462_g6.t1